MALCHPPHPQSEEALRRVEGELAAERQRAVQLEGQLKVRRGRQRTGACERGLGVRVRVLERKRAYALMDRGNGMARGGW